jgi:hypothetical protein
VSFGERNLDGQPDDQRLSANRALAPTDPEAVATLL